MSPKHILYRKLIFVIFDNILYPHISLYHNRTLFNFVRIGFFCMKSLLNIFCKHFASDIIDFFKSHHIIPLEFEERLDFCFKCLVLSIDTIFHMHANFFNALVHSQLFFIIIVKVEFLDEGFQAFKYSSHFQQ